MTKPSALLITPVALLALAGCGGSSPTIGSASTAVEVQRELPAPDPLQLAAASRTFIIGPFDTLSISVFGAPELTREGMVDSAGNFAVPLVGQVSASGKTPAELETDIADRLRGNYIRDPDVTVSVTKVQSRTITVDGAVKRPGVYPVMNNTTLQQAIAMAEGAGDFAQLREVAVFRTIDGRRMAALFDLEAIRAGRTLDPDLYANDIIVVGTNEGRRRLREALQAIPSFGVFAPVVN